MKKSRGLVSLEVIILSALGIIIVTVLMERCLNKRVLIEKYSNSCNLELQKNSEILEFIKEFVDIFYDNMNKQQLAKENEEVKEFEYSGDIDNEFNEDMESLENDEQIGIKAELEVIKNILGDSGFLKDGKILKYSDETDEFIVFDKVVNGTRRCYYYDYEFENNKLLLEEKQYYDYYK